MSFNISRVICLLFLGLCLFQSASGQGILKLVKHYADQEKACSEFDKCMTKLSVGTGGLPLTIKKVELGPNGPGISIPHILCARRSNCRHQQRAFCEPHMGANGTVEMRYLCGIAWMIGSDETDKSDPITSLLIEENQEVACFNYKQFMETPSEGFKGLQNVPEDAAPLGHIPKIAKQSLCSVRTNCLKEMKSVCDEERRVTWDMGHKIGKIASIFCSFVPYLEMEDKNSAGSRSIGGAATLSQQVLSDVCKSPTDGVCSLV